MAGDEVYGDDVTSGFLDRLAVIAGFRLTRAEARARHCCIRCGDQIDGDWTAIDLVEWNISLLCGACFDDATLDPDE